MFPFQIATSAAEPLVPTGDAGEIAFIMSSRFQRADAHIACTASFIGHNGGKAASSMEKKGHLEGCAHGGLLANSTQLRRE